MLALLGDGLLAGQTNPDGTACTWVGEGSNRTVLIWPTGYTAGGKPLGVFNEKGKEVAVVGGHYNIGGGLVIQDGLNSRTGMPGKVLGCGNVRAGWAAGLPFK